MGNDETGYINADELEVCESSQSEQCLKTEYQYVDISVPVELKPNASIGKIIAECCDEPVVYCKKNRSANTCEITLTQTICVKMQVDYDVSASIDNEKIKCESKQHCRK